MRKIISLALLNIKQGIKEKTFWVIVFFFLFLLGFAFFLGELSIGEKGIVLRNVGLSSIEISGLILIVFAFVLSFYREKETRLEEVYLSSFSGFNYLGGKLIGYLFLCLLYVLLTSLLMAVVLFLNSAFLWPVFLGSCGIFLKLSIFCSICLLFSSLFNHPVLASISTIFVYVGSEFSAAALKIINISKSNFAHLFFKFFHHLLPNSDKIDLKTMAIYGDRIQPHFLLAISFYVIVYILFCYFLSVLIFCRKEH